MTFRRAALLIFVATLAAMLAACGGSSSSTTQPISLGFTSGFMPPTSLNTAAPGNTAGIAVTITNGPQNATVNWTVSCGSAQCGSFNPASTASTVPTTYTAPASVPTGGTVTITATSANDSTKFITATINITASISLAFTAGFTPPTSMIISGTAGIAVTITNGPQNATVNWTVSCGSAQCGSFNPASTASTVPTTYTAPTSVPTGGTVTITATSADDSTKFITATITITSSVSVAFTSTPPTSVLIDSNTNLAATITGDPNNLGVTWSCTPASLCGTFTPTSTLSTVATSYAAPSAVPAGNTVTVTATSVTDNTKFAAATITITSNITVAFTPTFLPPSSMNTNTQVEVAAFTTGDPTNAGVTWSVTCGSASCGSFAPTTPTLNNVPVTYTSPLTVPTGNTVTITATSVSDFNQKVTSAPITIIQPTTTLPDGTYVFQVSGEDNNGQSPFYVAGAFAIESGAINGGEQDFVDLTLQGNDGIVNDSTIAITPDGNLQIVLDTGDTSIGVGGSGLETLNVALVTPTTGLVTWFDGFAAGSGTIALQDAAAAQTLPKYGYAFVTSGDDVDGAPVAMGGIVNVDDLGGTTGTISGAGSIFDINDGSELSGPEPDQPLAASTVAGPIVASTPDQYGKVVFTLNPNANPVVPTVAFAGYIVDSHTIALVEASDAFQGTTGGTALAQGQSNTGNFGTASLSGSSYVVGAQGQDPNDPLDFVGSLTFKSGGTVSGTTNFNDLTLESKLSATAGDYTVDATGRATVINITGTDLNLASGPATLQFYLDGNGNALVASMDTNDITAGPAFQQTTGALSGSYALSGFGFSVDTSNTWSAVGPIIIGGSGTIGSGSFTDFNYFGATLPASECVTAGPTCADLALTGTASTPSGTITGLDADTILTPPILSDTFDLYVIDDFRAFGIETGIPPGNIQTGLLYLQAPSAPRPRAKTHK